MDKLIDTKSKHVEIMNELKKGKRYEDVRTELNVSNLTMNLLKCRLTKKQSEIVYKLQNNFTPLEIARMEGEMKSKIINHIDQIIDRAKRIMSCDIASMNVDMNSLTDKQKVIIDKLRQGSTVKELGEELNIKYCSVSNRIETIRKKHDNKANNFINHIDVNELTPKQKETVEKLREGRSTIEISKMSDIEEKTVKSRIVAIKRKTGILSEQKKFIHDVNVDILTKKQKSIVEKTRRGATTQKVADELNLERITIYKHLERIERKHEKSLLKRTSWDSNWIPILCYNVINKSNERNWVNMNKDELNKMLTSLKKYKKSKECGWDKHDISVMIEKDLLNFK